MGFNAKQRPQVGEPNAAPLSREVALAHTGIKYAIPEAPLLAVRVFSSLVSELPASQQKLSG